MATLTKLDDLVLKALKPRDKPYNKHLGGGLYAYVYPNGRVVCKYQYQMDGKRRKLTLGDYVLNKGRAALIFKEYERVHGNRILNNVDPVAEQEKRKAEDNKIAAAEAKQVAEEVAEKLAKENRVTVTELAEHFMEKYTGNSTERTITDSTMQTYRWMIGKYVIPEFGQYPLDDLPEDAILDFIEKMAETRPTGANQLHAMMSAMFRWAIEQRKYNNPNTGARKFRRNPLAGVKRPAPKVKRNRVLDFGVRHGKFKDKGEIKAFWEWLNTINPNHADALRLILMMGVRPSEALGLQWEDIFEDEIVIPAEKMKSQHSFHTIPLTLQLNKLIEDIRARAKKTGYKDYLFPKRPRSRGGLPESKRSYPHVGHATLSGLVLNATRLGDLDISKFSPHDLRRSVATHVGSLGFGASDVNALLHHKETGVIEHYDFSDPIEKKLAMLTAWHNRVDELIEGKHTDNVVNIRNKG